MGLTPTQLTRLLYKSEGSLPGRKMTHLRGWVWSQLPAAHSCWPLDKLFNLNKFWQITSS